MTPRCPHADDSGAWVLGALGDEDARAFAVHLPVCAQCRARVDELRAAVDVLPADLEQIAPSPQLGERIMRVVRAEAELLQAAGAAADRPEPARRSPLRRALPAGLLRPRRAVALAATVAAIAVGAIALATSGGDDVERYAATAPAGATVALEVRGDHGQLVLRDMPSARPGRVFQVWTVAGDEAPQPTTTLFAVPADGDARVAIDVALDGVDAILVTEEPSGGSQTPSGAPLIAAELS